MAASMMGHHSRLLIERPPDHSNLQMVTIDTPYKILTSLLSLCIVSLIFISFMHFPLSEVVFLQDKPVESSPKQYLQPVLTPSVATYSCVSQHVDRSQRIPYDDGQYICFLYYYFHVFFY